jgi:hypothetical protein
LAKKVNLDKDFQEVPETTLLVEDSDIPVEIVNEPTLPPKWSVERTKYILSFLDETEVFNGSPKVAGLRRLVEKFIGEIVESRTTFHVVDLEHHGAAATHSVVIERLQRSQYQKIGPFEGSADASVFNNDNAKFVVFPTALAETRSKGRCYINCLGISCTASEEFCSGEPLAKVDSEQFGEAKISDAQLSAIETVCRTANMNTNSILKMYASKFERSRISELSKSEGLFILRDINKYQQNEEVPQNLQGFQAIKRGN